MFYDKTSILVFKTSWSIYFSPVNSNALKMHFCHSDTSLLQKWFACSRCSALFTNLGVNVFQGLEDILPTFFPCKSHLYFSYLTLHLLSVFYNIYNYWSTKPCVYYCSESETLILAYPVLSVLIVNKINSLLQEQFFICVTFKLHLIVL